MSCFYTIVAFDEDGRDVTDTDVNTNSHRSVRSYKTEHAARQAILRGTKMDGVTYRILGVFILVDEVVTRWLE